MDETLDGTNVHVGAAKPLEATCGRVGKPAHNQQTILRLSNFKAGALLTFQHRVCFVVADEHFRFGVPL
ncbi:hypothetical protein V22_03570 [Calycomorphotria hydatis]|uniref:Uncharacterized protein n=1 Tax=Calycomorphotria hydatis TaxID=2528027 RepID=A0A517T451_9PLAN|nr:hypothetical protein V22_03570 [Calycomorphotria hydatis]